MRKDFKTIASQFFDTKSIVVFGLVAALSGPAFAFKSGHGSVLSDAGAPLQIAIPLLELTAQEMDSLQVRLADADAWSKIGLTPPVGLDDLKVNVVSGFTPGSRRLMISSSQPASRSPVDILLDITTSSGALQIQSSYLVTLPSEPSSRSSAASSGGPVSASGAGSNTGSNTVKRGETLYSIAQRNAVSGVDMYQMLAAIFEANPDAFISGNMNLLRAGATLHIPDADTIRAMDKTKARKLYQSQVQAFNEMRRANQSARAAASVSSQNQTAKPSTAPKSASSSTAGTQATTQPADQVRLTSTNPADQKDDVRTAAKNEAEELNSRIKTLQDNVEKLKDASTGSQAGASSSPSTSGSSANAASSGTAATPGSAPSASSGSTTATDASSTSGSSAVSGGGTTDKSGSTPSTSSDSASDAKTASATSAGASNTTTNETPKSGSAGSAADKSRSDFFSRANLLAKWESFTGLLAENIVYALAALLALGALVIAWMMRRAGERLDDEPEEGYSAARANPAVQSAFGQKLSDIDLNLDPADVDAAKTPTPVPPTLTKQL